MCDTVDGEIIVASPAEGSPISQYLAELAHDDRAHDKVGMRHAGSLAAAIDSAGATPGAVGHAMSASLYVCHPGREAFVTSQIYQDYGRWAAEHGWWMNGFGGIGSLDLWVGPNHVVTVSGTSPGGSAHSDSWLEFAVERRSVGAIAPRVAVIDSGVAREWPTELPAAVQRRSFLRGGKPAVDDTSGHGSTVASCIARVADGVEVNALQVVDSANRATEWDVLAALATDEASSADVVNLSLAFGLQDANCGPCGWRHRSSMSLAFAHAVRVLAEKGVVVVAAAGNHRATSAEVDDSTPVLLFPARLDNVVAVSALDEFGAVLPSSNVGDDHPPVGENPTLFFAPGQPPDSGRRAATSFACGYVSAMVAVLKTSSGVSGPDAIQMLMASAAPLGAAGRFGHGRVCWPDC